MTPEPEDRSVRIKALIGLAIALMIGVAGWVGLSTATERGLERLAAIDRARTACEKSWATAATRAETLRVDGIALADTIDRRSEQAIDRCGDLRDQEPTTPPNPREMNGAPMPRGLR